MPAISLAILELAVTGWPAKITFGECLKSAQTTATFKTVTIKFSVLLCPTDSNSGHKLRTNTNHIESVLVTLESPQTEDSCSTQV